MSKKLLIALTSILAVGAMAISASAASAAERIWENEAETELAPVGTNFSAVNTTSATLTAGTLVITCPTSFVSGTITTNTVTSVTTTITDVEFGGKCHDNAVPSHFVRVTTNTTTAWTLTVTGVKKLTLTGINATIEDNGLICKVKNKAGEAFELAWANKATDSTLAASNAPVELTGTGCPAAGKETVTYSINGAPDEANNLWMS